MQVFEGDGTTTEMLTWYTCFHCRIETMRNFRITDPLPAGWRRTRRGFAGTVYLCPDCGVRKHKPRKPKQIMSRLNLSPYYDYD